jgi:hypothetical protein
VELYEYTNVLEKHTAFFLMAEVKPAQTGKQVEQKPDLTEKYSGIINTD